MARKTLVIIHMPSFNISELSSCSTNQSAVDIHNSRISLDWAGVYTGIMPYKGSIIEIRLKLKYDDSFEFILTYINSSRGHINWEGSFKWDDTGNIIMLDVVNAHLVYHVTSNKLIRLNIEENMIKGNPIYKHELVKEQLKSSVSFCLEETQKRILSEKG